MPDSYERERENLRQRAERVEAELQQLREENDLQRKQLAELSADYCALSAKRLSQLSLLSEVGA